jgi:hypothetical protein
MIWGRCRVAYNTTRNRRLSVQASRVHRPLAFYAPASWIRRGANAMTPTLRLLSLGSNPHGGGRLVDQGLNQQSGAPMCGCLRLSMRCCGVHATAHPRCELDLGAGHPPKNYVAVPGGESGHAHKRG